MNQDTLGGVLAEMWSDEFSSRVTVQESEGGDQDNPRWVQIATAVEVEIQQSTAAERQAKEADYSHPVTHQGFCVRSSIIQIGRRLIETHRKLQDGTWVAALDTRTFEVLGIEVVRGVPEPNNQWRLDLCDMGPTIAL